MLRPRKIKDRFLSSDTPENDTGTVLLSFDTVIKTLCRFVREDLDGSVLADYDKIPEGAVFLSVTQLAYALRLIVSALPRKEILNITFSFTEDDFSISFDGMLVFSTDSKEQLYTAGRKAGFRVNFTDTGLILSARREAYIPSKLYQGEREDLILILRAVFFG